MVYGFSFVCLIYAKAQTIWNPAKNRTAIALQYFLFLIPIIFSQSYHLIYLVAGRRIICAYDFYALG